MIISISGAQGQGKSTVLAALKEKNYTVVENKTARSILSDWGVSLDEVYLDKPLAQRFHDEILKRHDEYCEQYYHSEDIAFIERSFADIFSYALAVLGPHNTYSSWLDSFYESCKANQAKMSGVMYISGRVYVPEPDGVRSTNKHFSDIIDTSIKRYLKEFSDTSRTHLVYDINYSDRKYRVSAIESVIERYFDV